MSKPAPTVPIPENVLVPLPRLTALVRQLTHDVRNGLNNVDLQAALLQELTTDAQVAPEIKRLRGMVSDTAKMLQEFSRRFWFSEPSLVSYSASAFLEDFRSRLEKALPQAATQIVWTVDLEEEKVAVDIEMMFRALAEFFKNAFHFREGDTPIEVTVGRQNGKLAVKLVEAKSSVLSAPETWGVEPLVTTRRSGFGMGLFYARQVISLHDGEVAFAFDRGKERLTTRVSLPLATQ